MKVRRASVLLLLEKFFERSLLLRRARKHDRQMRKQQIVCDFAKIILGSRPRSASLGQLFSRMACKAFRRLPLASLLGELPFGAPDRITLAPDVELHVRRPLASEQNRRVERLLEAARAIFQEIEP